MVVDIKVTTPRKVVAGPGPHRYVLPRLRDELVKSAKSGWPVDTGRSRDGLYAYITSASAPVDTSAKQLRSRRSFKFLTSDAESDESSLLKISPERYARRAIIQFANEWDYAFWVEQKWFPLEHWFRFRGQLIANRVNEITVKQYIKAGLLNKLLGYRAED